MTTPFTDACRFGWGLLIGAALGIVYGFLRPLRPRHTTFADFLFALAACYGYLLLQFGICQADVRLAYFLAMICGCILWEWSFGRCLRPVFSFFWAILERIRKLLLLPLKKIWKMTKILFASVKKWVTIDWYYCDQHLFNRGGKHHG